MDKSPWLAVVLTLIFGPLGLLYVAVVPALILLLISITGYFTLGATTLLAWIVSIIWGGAVASRRHRAFLKLAGFDSQSRDTRSGSPASGWLGILPVPNRSAPAGRLVSGCARPEQGPLVGREQVG